MTERAPRFLPGDPVFRNRYGPLPGDLRGLSMGTVICCRYIPGTGTPLYPTPGTCTCTWTYRILWCVNPWGFRQLDWWSEDKLRSGVG